MNKNNSVLDSIKAKIGAEKVPKTATAPVIAAAEDEKRRNLASQEARSIDSALAEGGFVQLFRELEAAREGLNLGRKIVYIDDDTAEVLDLLRKKAKIKSNLLVSCLLQELIIKHRDLIQELVEKRANKLLE